MVLIRTAIGSAHDKSSDVNALITSCIYKRMLVSSVRIPKGGRGAFAFKSEVQRETLVVVAAPRELEAGSRDGRVLG